MNQDGMSRGEREETLYQFRADNSLDLWSGYNIYIYMYIYTYSL